MCPRGPIAERHVRQYHHGIWAVSTWVFAINVLQLFSMLDSFHKMLEEKNLIATGSDQGLFPRVFLSVATFLPGCPLNTSMWFF